MDNLSRIYNVNKAAYLKLLRGGFLDTRPVTSTNLDGYDIYREIEANSKKPAEYIKNSFTKLKTPEGKKAFFPFYLPYIYGNKDSLAGHSVVIANNSDRIIYENRIDDSPTYYRLDDENFRLSMIEIREEIVRIERMKEKSNHIVNTYNTDKVDIVSFLSIFTNIKLFLFIFHQIRKIPEYPNLSPEQQIIPSLESLSKYVYNFGADQYTNYNPLIYSFIFINEFDVLRQLARDVVKIPTTKNETDKVNYPDYSNLDAFKISNYKGSNINNFIQDNLIDFSPVNDIATLNGIIYVNTTVKDIRTQTKKNRYSQKVADAIRPIAKSLIYAYNHFSLYQRSKLYDTQIGNKHPAIIYSKLIHDLTGFLLTCQATNREFQSTGLFNRGSFPVGEFLLMGYFIHTMQYGSNIMKNITQQIDSLLDVSDETRYNLDLNEFYRQKHEESKVKSEAEAATDKKKNYSLDLYNFDSDWGEETDDNAYGRENDELATKLFLGGLGKKNYTRVQQILIKVNENKFTNCGESTLMNIINYIILPYDGTEFRISNKYMSDHLFAFYEKYPTIDSILRQQTGASNEFGELLAGKEGIIYYQLDAQCEIVPTYGGICKLLLTLFDKIESDLSGINFGNDAFKLKFILETIDRKCSEEFPDSVSNDYQLDINIKINDPKKNKEEDDDDDDDDGSSKDEDKPFDYEEQIAINSNTLMIIDEFYEYLFTDKHAELRIDPFNIEVSGEFQVFETVFENMKEIFFDNLGTLHKAIIFRKREMFDDILTKPDIINNINKRGDNLDETLVMKALYHAQLYDTVDDDTGFYMYRKLVKVPELDINAMVNYDDEILINYLIKNNYDMKFIDPLFERNDVNFDLSHDTSSANKTALSLILKRLEKDIDKVSSYFDIYLPPLERIKLVEVLTRLRDSKSFGVIKRILDNRFSDKFAEQKEILGGDAPDSHKEAAVSAVIQAIKPYNYDVIVKNKNLITKIITYRSAKNIQKYEPVNDKIRMICLVGEFLDVYINIKSRFSAKYFPYGLIDKNDFKLKLEENGITPLLYLTQNYKKKNFRDIIFLALDQEHDEDDDEDDGLFEELMQIPGPNGLTPNDYAVINNHYFDNIYTPQFNPLYSMILEDRSYFLEKIFKSFPRNVENYFKDEQIEFQLPNMMEVDENGRNVMHRIFERLVYPKRDYFKQKKILMRYIESNAPDIGTAEHRNLIDLFSAPFPKNGKYIYEIVVADEDSSSEVIRGILKWTDPKVISYSIRVGDAQQKDMNKPDEEFKPYLLTEIVREKYVLPETLAQMKFELPTMTDLDKNKRNVLHLITNREGANYLQVILDQIKENILELEIDKYDNLVKLFSLGDPKIKYMLLPFMVIIMLNLEGYVRLAIRLTDRDIFAKKGSKIIQLIKKQKLSKNQKINEDALQAIKEYHSDAIPDIESLLND